MTPQAVKTSNAESVRALLKERIDVNASQPDGATALHWAVHRDDATTADLLIRAGARANVANDLASRLSFWPARIAARPWSGDCWQQERIRTQRCCEARPCSWSAPVTGDVGAVTALLAAGAQVNAKESINDQTALMWAASQQHPRVVQALVELGADIHARSRTYPQNVETGNEGEAETYRPY